jgi:para-aminobenzoate synthetase component I
VKNIFYQEHDLVMDVKEIFRSFSDLPYSFLMESSLQHGERGRFSFMGADPVEHFSLSGQGSLEVLKKHFEKYQDRFEDCPVPFVGGMVGCLGYELGLVKEGLSLPIGDDLYLPDCLMGFYDGIIAVDHYKEKIFLIATGMPEKDPVLRERMAQAKIKDLSRRVFQRISSDERREFYQRIEHDRLILESNFTRDEYIKAVQRALRHIARGDIYQINLSQRFLFHYPPEGFVDPFDVYRSLSSNFPSNFSAFFDAGDFKIISHSPEEFLRLRGRALYTFPMKGTRPRGQDIFEDETLKNDLLNSPKEKAELLMVTDLERNDLGRVCEYGSIDVSSPRFLEQYKNVFQTLSVVQGVLRQDKDAFDILTACFPSGSVTGCPKIRAMQIISEIEKTKRGPYTGCLGYLSFSGDMDFNVLIRTFVHKKRQLSFHVGGGIVSDSIPEDEYEETLIKAKALRQTLCQVGGVL